MLQTTARVGSKRRTGPSWETPRDVVLCRDAPEAEKFGKRSMGPAVPVPLFSSNPLAASTLQRGFRCGRRLLPGQPHVCVPEVPGHLLSVSSGSQLLGRGRSWDRSRRVAQGMQTVLLTPPQEKYKDKESPTSLLLVTQGACCPAPHRSSPVCSWGWFLLSGSMCYSVGTRKVWG